MRILAIADRPPRIPISTIIINENIDLIVTLGDLEYVQIAELGSIHHIPKIGVYGNHCTPGYFEQLDITDVHLKTVEVNGVSFGGFEGSHRYKKDTFAKMYTQEEASFLMKNFPYVDVFIAHSSPATINDEEDPAYHGLIALKQYLDEERPRYFFHGHTYPNEAQLVTQYGDTEIVYVSAYRIVDVKI